MKVMDIFSRRHGYDTPKTLWEHALPKEFYDGLENVVRELNRRADFEVCFAYCARNLAWPVPEHHFPGEYVKLLRSRPWHETLSSLELITEYLVLKEWNEVAGWFILSIDHLLEFTNVNWSYGESWRFVKRIENIAIIENALRVNIDKFDPAREQLKNAWELFNKRPDPDYANSIKEAITAVESAAKISTNSDKADLGKALDKLALHPALKQGIEKLYAYASDEPGVRHGGTEASDVDEAEAELMLTICASVMVFLAKTHANRTAEGAG